MTNTKREFDLVIFGPTGFTGSLIVRELVLSLEEKKHEYDTLKWAIAGRNVDKMNEVLNNIGVELGKNLSGIAQIEANVSDRQSLVEMAQRTKLVLNCVGPYPLNGIAVVDACVHSGTDQIDLGAEATYVEGVQLEYDEKAKQSESLIISTCGWMTIPADVGVQYLKRHFPGQLHSVDSFKAIHPGPHGYVYHFSTFYSGIYFISAIFEYLKIHSRLNKEVFSRIVAPESRLKHLARLMPFVEPKSGTGWNVFMPSEKEVIERTQHYNYAQWNERPVQVNTYFCVGKFVNLFKMAISSIFIIPLAFFGAGRRLLGRFPEVFTLGYVTKEGPSRTQCDSTRFSQRLIAKGWSTAVKLDPTNNEEPAKQLDKEMTLLISGPDPAYFASATCIVQAALTIFKDRDQMPKGGVLTPASAFRDTKLVERLRSREVKFEIVDS